MMTAAWVNRGYINPHCFNGGLKFRAGVVKITLEAGNTLDTFGSGFQVVASIMVLRE